jgi:hypothetical protein
MKTLQPSALALALVLAASAPHAEEKKDPGDVKYHAAPSALADVPMVESRNPKAPPSAAPAATACCARARPASR